MNGPSELEVLLGVVPLPEPQPEPGLPPLAKNVTWQRERSVCNRCHGTWTWRRYVNLKLFTYRICSECTAIEVNRQNRVRVAMLRSIPEGGLRN